MRVLITGGSGGLAVALGRELEKEHEVLALPHSELDVTSQLSIDNWFAQNHIDLVCHCAAIVNADYVENHKELAYHVNVEGTRNIALACRKNHAKLVFFSSDYVFSGDKDEPYDEADMVYPLNYYGVTKILGEQIVRSILDTHYIVRIQWLFGETGNTFFHKILDRKNESFLNVVNDQRGCPTYTMDLAKAVGQLIQLNHYGIYYLSSEGSCTWAEYAREILALSKGHGEINEVSSDQYSTAAKRPKNSVLSKKKSYSCGIDKLPDWRDALYRCYFNMHERMICQ